MAGESPLPPTEARQPRRVGLLGVDGAVMAVQKPCAQAGLLRMAGIGPQEEPLRTAARRDTPSEEAVSSGQTAPRSAVNQRSGRMRTTT